MIHCFTLYISTIDFFRFIDILSIVLMLWLDIYGFYYIDNERFAFVVVAYQENINNKKFLSLHNTQIAILLTNLQAFQICLKKYNTDESKGLYDIINDNIKVLQTQQEKIKNSKQLDFIEATLFFQFLKNLILENIIIVTTFFTTDMERKLLITQDIHKVKLITTEQYDGNVAFIVKYLITKNNFMQQIHKQTFKKIFKQIVRYHQENNITTLVT